MEAATIVDKTELPSMMKPHDGTTFFRCKTDPPVYLAVVRNEVGNSDFRIDTVLADLTSQPRRVRESKTGSIADEIADLTEEIAEIRKELDKLRAEKDLLPKGGRAEIGKAFNAKSNELAKTVDRRKKLLVELEQITAKLGSE